MLVGSSRLAASMEGRSEEIHAAVDGFDGSEAVLGKRERDDGASLEAALEEHHCVAIPGDFQVYAPGVTCRRIMQKHIISCVFVNNVEGTALLCSQCWQKFQLNSRSWRTSQTTWTRHIKDVHPDLWTRAYGMLDTYACI